MADMIDKLLAEDDRETSSLLTVEAEEFFETTIPQYETFDEESWKKGQGYCTKTFPIFDKAMEGLENGMFLFAGPSNHGKTAILQELLMSYALNEDNNLFGIYFSLDDGADKIIPRIIASNIWRTPEYQREREEAEQTHLDPPFPSIPITVVSKPSRYKDALDAGDVPDGMASTYEEYLRLRENGLAWLKTTNERFKIVDRSKIHNGEQMLDYCQKLQAYVRAQHGDNANIIVGIDSLSDIEWDSKRFNTEKEKNDYCSSKIKEWSITTLGCPIFGSIHLRKTDPKKRPTVMDIKESGRWIYEASLAFIVYNDIAQNRQTAGVFYQSEGSEFFKPVIELHWAKNKQSSFKGMTFCYFDTPNGRVWECSEEATEHYSQIIYTP